MEIDHRGDAKSDTEEAGIAAMEAMNAAMELAQTFTNLQLRDAGHANADPRVTLRQLVGTAAQIIARVAINGVTEKDTPPVVVAEAFSVVLEGMLLAVNGHAIACPLSVRVCEIYNTYHDRYHEMVDAKLDGSKTVVAYEPDDNDGTVH